MRNLPAHFERLHNNPPPPFNPSFDPNTPAIRKLRDERLRALEDDYVYNQMARSERAEFHAKLWDECKEAIK